MNTTSMQTVNKTENSCAGFMARLSASMRKRHVGAHIVRALIILSAVITAAIVLFIVGYIIVMGVPHLKLSMFEWNYTTENVSMMPAIINTVTMTLMTLIVSVPIGVFAAVYLVEYAKRGSRFVKIIRTTAETLTGIPSIVYGLFGFLMFNIQFRWGYTMLGGIFTLSIMILPVIMRSTEEALLAVPDSFREGSFGLGAGRLRTVFKVVLPSAVPGILSGVILGIGRIVGETAALIYPTGTGTGVTTNLMSSGRTLAVHMYALLSEGLYVDQAYATAVILLIMVVIINALSGFVAGKLKGKS